MEHGYTITDDQSRFDIDAIHRFISEESYWGRGRSRETVAASIAGSFCLAMLAPDGSLAGFCRCVTDYATNAHVMDVFLLPPHRGQGRGKALIEALLFHPKLSAVTRWTLSTSDAHSLYARYGFTNFPKPENQMIRQLAR